MCELTRISNNYRLNTSHFRKIMILMHWRRDHFPIDLEPPNGRPFAVSNQPENGIHNLIPVRFNQILKRFPCA